MPIYLVRVLSTQAALVFWFSATANRDSITREYLRPGWLCLLGYADVGFEGAGVYQPQQE